MTWQKGESGNPGGRPAGYGDVRELARTHTEAAVSTLVEIMNDKGAAPSARTSAASSLLDRAWGRPEQTLSASIKEEESYIDALKSINEQARLEKSEKVLAAPE